MYENLLDLLNKSMSLSCFHLFLVSKSLGVVRYLLLDQLNLFLVKLFAT